MKVYKTICKHIELTAVMDRLEQRFGIKSCVNSLTKLVKLAEKTESLAERRLVFYAVEDAIDRNIHTNSKFTREFLVTPGAFGISFVQLTIFKWKV